jgi:hypothetical protein
MTKVIFPSELKTVIMEKVVAEILNHPNTQSWNNEVSSKLQADNTFNNTTKDHHRLNLCGQGQADFRNGVAGLTTEDIALLYCYYFFQMHFTSSTALFHYYSNLIVGLFNESNKICFVDIGCGPFTSGLAFLHFTRLKGIKDKIGNRIAETQLEYYGIDNADSMRNLGSVLQSTYEMTVNDGGFKYFGTAQNSFYQNIPELIGQRGEETTIILNCCYFFASETLNVQDFTTAIQQLINNNPNSRILLFYQNAPTGSVQVGQKYLNFRSAIQGLSSGGTNIDELSFSYDDEFKSAKRGTLNLRARFQLLKNY